MAIPPSTPIVDQAQEQSWNWFPVDYWSQTFRTGSDVYNITGFDIDFAQAGTFRVEVRKVSPYVVVGTSAWVSVPAGVNHIDLAPMALASPETDYEFRIFDTTPNFSGDYAVKGIAGSNPYVRGTARFPGGGNDTYGHDWFFRTYFVPEPSSLIGLLGGLSGLAIVIRGPRRAA